MEERPGWSATQRAGWKDLARIGIGHGIYGVFNWFCDHILYVFVVYQLGLVIGGGLMTAFSLTQCLITLLVYERMRVDWVGAGALAQIRIGRPTRWRQALNWITRQNNVVAFLSLSFFQDPFITTAYFRCGRFDGLKTRDWRIFLSSVLLGNLYWTLRAGFLAKLISMARSAWITS